MMRDKTFTESLSERSEAWLKRYGTPNAAFIRTIVSGKKYAPVEAEMEPLLAHAGGLAQALNGAINTALNHEAAPEGVTRSYGQLNLQLRRAQKTVREAVIAQAKTWEPPTELSETQLSALQDVYDAWRARVGHNIGANGPQR